MSTRRGFLTGLLATGLAPLPTWADAGSPAFLAAARRADGQFALFGLSQTGAIVFQIALPDRGHAAAAHPSRPEAVAFARRPGTFAVVIDCRTGQGITRLNAPEGRHFYGHGAFSQDGRYLLTSENDYGAGRGVIGIWDAARGYVRIGEFDSAGIGPHDIKRMPGQDVFVVANGGIDTHPDSGRTKLNIPTMMPNLTYLGMDGTVVDQVQPQPQHRMNSIRHLAVSNQGQVAFGLQWQGGARSPNMLGLHRIGQGLRYLSGGATATAALNGYVGSVAFSGSGKRVAVTSPRGGVAQVFDVATETMSQQIAAPDICGVAPDLRVLGDDGFVLTTGNGTVLSGAVQQAQHDVNWDNHLVPILPG